MPCTKDVPTTYTKDLADQCYHALLLYLDYVVFFSAAFGMTRVGIEHFLGLHNITNILWRGLLGMWLPCISRWQRNSTTQIRKEQLVALLCKIIGTGVVHRLLMP